MILRFPGQRADEAAVDDSNVVPVDPTARLVQRCQRGDERAWAALYEQEAPRVARFMRRLLGPDRETDDAIQQVFVELFSSLPRFRGEAKLSTWLYRIACNVAGKRIRTESRRRRRMAALLDWTLGAGPDGGAPAPDRHAVARQELTRLAAAVDGLPVGQRMVWVLREVEGQSTEEVGLALGISPGTVRSRLHHARRKVNARLDRAGEERVR